MLVQILDQLMFDFIEIKLVQITILLCSKPLGTANSNKNKMHFSMFKYLIINDRISNVSVRVKLFINWPITCLISVYLLVVLHFRIIYYSTQIMSFLVKYIMNKETY